MSTNSIETATLGGGCYWCLEAVFEQVNGVSAVRSGFSGGHVVSPTYRQVCEEGTGHAEVVQVDFNPDIISYSELLEIFFGIHDPTTLNRQGGDVGPQYRSAIFFHSPQQAESAKKMIETLNAATIWPSPIVTEVIEFKNFYPAGVEHEGYYRAHPTQPYCQAVVGPKVAKFRKSFSHRLRS